MTEIKTTISPVQPKYYPVKCPICSGFGTISFKRIRCHGCGGLGYLKIPVESKSKEREKDDEEPLTK